MGPVEQLLAEIEQELLSRGLTWDQAFPILCEFLSLAEAIVGRV